MRVADTTERGLERLVVSQMTGLSLDELIARERQGGPADGCAEEAATFTGPYDWRLGDPRAYDRRWCLDVGHLVAFLRATQPEVADAVQIERDTPARTSFLQRLSSEVEKRGVIDVLRRGVRHLGHPQIDFYYGLPSAENARAQGLHAQNRFVVTRQLRYSEDETQRALDLGLFVNGLPVATAELKNSLTRQTVADAVHQYQTDRDPREPLFRMGRCAVHFAVDDSSVKMCTALKGKASWFLPFDKGVGDGAGNPPNPDGVKTDYLWRETLRPDSLCDILENYAQIVEERDPKTGRKKRKQIFPRYHQLHGVRTLLADAREHGAGGRYLIQHSAGSGKSNSIAWLAHQLVGLRRDGGNAFDTVVVVTDRVNLDKQIKATIQSFVQVAGVFQPVRSAEQLASAISAGKKIIVTTVQTFPFLLDKLGDEHRGRRFAIIIDEAHSSQSGRNAAAMAGALGAREDEEDGPEDEINAALQERMASRRMPENASYFAFTATPKQKTLELFGTPDGTDEQGRPRRRAFHAYTMKQAIEEGFILDVLTNYTPIESYYSLLKVAEDDPEFDAKRAQGALRAYVERQDHAVQTKAGIMVDHFHARVAQRIGGEARVMVVASGIERAIRYYQAIKAALAERKSPYDAIVAFSGEKEVDGETMTEASLNGFPSADIEDAFEDEAKRYRFLVCAEKFQTGFDQPLLQAMYVDKTLGGVQAVQTLSRLNRAHPKKRAVFVLDFANDADAIQTAFEPYYRTTVLSGETDPNRLHDLAGQIEGAGLFGDAERDEVVAAFMAGALRDQIDPTLDRVAARYAELDEDGQIAFKAPAKDYVRTYEFLGAILPYTNEAWERLSIFLTLLVRKLPTPQSDDLTAGILDTIDLDSYRVEKREEQRIRQHDADGDIEPLPGDGTARRPEPELEPLSVILRTFNERFGADFTDADKVFRRIEEELAPGVLSAEAFTNAMKNTPENANDVLSRTLSDAVAADLTNGTELYRAYSQNEGFRTWLFAHLMRKANAGQPSV